MDGVFVFSFWNKVTPSVNAFTTLYDSKNIITFLYN